MRYSIGEDICRFEELFFRGEKVGSRRFSKARCHCSPCHSASSHNRFGALGSVAHGVLAMAMFLSGFQ
jgi:hypothetical protein